MNLINKDLKKNKKSLIILLKLFFKNKHSIPEYNNQQFNDCLVEGLIEWIYGENLNVTSGKTQ